MERKRKIEFEMKVAAVKDYFNSVKSIYYI